MNATAADTAPGVRAPSMALRHPILWVCALHILLALVLFDPKPFLGGDNFWYMLLAEGLQDGEGYRDLWLPGGPAHTRYPPVYPLLLAGIGLITQSVLAFKLLSLLFTTGVCALVFLLAERRARDRQLALFAALLVACSPLVIEYGHWVLSEPAFVFFVVLALFCFARDVEHPDWRYFAAGTAGAILASLTRSAGYPLLLAAVIALVAHRRWKRAAIFVAAAALSVGGWWLRNRLVVSGDVPYTQWLRYRDPYRPEQGTITAVELAGRFFDNLRVYTFTVLPESFAGRDVVGGAAVSLGILLAAAVLLALALRIRKLEPAELFLVLYAGLILLWPAAWADQRLLLPLVPLLAVLIMEATHWVVRQKRWIGGGSFAFFIAGTALVGLAAFGNIRIMAPAIHCAQEYRRGNRYACYPPPVGDFIETAFWARENTEANAIVINRKPQIFYWYSRRRGDVYPFTENADSIIRFLDSQDADYVVIDLWSATTLRYLIPAVQKHLDQFEVVHQQGDPPSFLLRYRRISHR